MNSERHKRIECIGCLVGVLANLRTFLHLDTSDMSIGDKILTSATIIFGSIGIGTATILGLDYCVEASDKRREKVKTASTVESYDSILVTDSTGTSLVCFASGTKEECDNLLNAMKTAVTEATQTTIKVCLKESNIHACEGISMDIELNAEVMAAISVKKAKGDTDNYILCMPTAEYVRAVERKLVK